MADNKEKMEEKAKKGLEVAEKVGSAVDKGVQWTDDKLSTVPGMLGDKKPKVMVGLVALGVIAVLRDPTIALIGVVVLAVLNLSGILAAVKKSAAKKSAEKTEQKQDQPKQ